ncbi:uncharacterized protein LOC111268257 isoform X2 [Varroa jacobsoni]|uniref:uncharacterized protein LOC111268257 isoform X2 n=1 Tax=Varroa jacobsoni TaxID=62625 RepID=UPI000BFA99A5|nr:uncharacterized protein LOC111268257 isoform X2 [Varroa jacobsoni]
MTRFVCPASRQERTGSYDTVTANMAPTATAASTLVCIAAFSGGDGRRANDGGGLYELPFLILLREHLLPSSFVSLFILVESISTLPTLTGCLKPEQTKRRPGYIVAARARNWYLGLVSCRVYVIAEADYHRVWHLPLAAVHNIMMI